MKGEHGAFDAIVRLMCEDGDDLTVKFRQADWTCEVSIEASATDVCRLVGERARTFNALANLLRGIGKGQRRDFTLLPVTAKPGTVRRDFKPFEDRDWPALEVLRIVSELVGEAFPGAIAVPFMKLRGSTTEIIVEVATPLKRPAVEFGKALNQVMRVVGIQVGRMLNAKVVPV